MEGCESLFLLSGEFNKDYWNKFHKEAECSRIPISQGSYRFCTALVVSLCRSGSGKVGFLQLSSQRTYKEID